MIFVPLLKGKLHEIVLQANLAKLKTSTNMSGFSDNLHHLPSQILTKISFSLKNAVSLVKENIRKLENKNMKPLDQSAYLRLQVLSKGLFHV